MRCEKCGFEVKNENSKFCLNCGAAIEEPVFCSDCGKKILKEDEGLYCAYCGERILDENDDSQFCQNCGNAFQNNNKPEKYCKHCGKELGNRSNVNISESASKLFDRVRANIDAEQLKGTVSDVQDKLAEGKSAVQEKIEQGRAAKEERNVQMQAQKELKQQSNFVDPTEIQLAVLGSGYVQNILLDSSFKRGSAVLTDKRVYYKGKRYGMNEGLKSMSSQTEEAIVPLEDVSCTNFVHLRKPGFLIIGILLVIIFIGVILPFTRDGGEWISFLVLGTSLINFIAYFLSKKTYFQISFPGGRFMFDLVYYPIVDAKDFQRQIYLAKDQFKREERL